jgi:hypothetical protein
MKQSSLWRSAVVVIVMFSLALAWASLTIVTMSQRHAAELARLTEQHNELRKHLAETGLVPGLSAQHAAAQVPLPAAPYQPLEQAQDAHQDAQAREVHQPGRRLTDLKTIVALTSNTATSGCVSFSDPTGNAQVIDMSSATCAAGSYRCPPCFIATSLAAATTLDIVACSSMINGPSNTANAISNVLAQFTFVNLDTADTLTINAKATTGGAVVSQYDLAPLESVNAYCLETDAISDNILYFPLQHTTPATYSKKGHLDKLAFNDPGATITWDTTEPISSASAVHIIGQSDATKANNMQTLGERIGTAPSDTVAFKAGQTTIGYLTTAHGYIEELGAADPLHQAGASISYVTANTPDTACTGTTRVVCSTAR